MHSIRIFTFSGTGNTAFVAEALVNALHSKGVEASSYPLEKIAVDNRPESLLEADLIGIAFPVHAFNPPPLVEKIIRRLPAAKAQKYFILKTAGDPYANGGTTTHLQKILRKKLWQLQYEALVPMPSNVLLRYPDPFIKLIGQMSIKMAEQIATDLLEETRKTIPGKRSVRILAALMQAERLGAKFYGHYLKVNPNCTNCGICVRDCPTGNIRLRDGKFTFNWNCTACLRCSFNCPVQAFSQKHMGKLGLLKSPYDLHAIMNNPAILPADLADDSIAGLKHFRRFWFRAGVID